jgi:hypothetical protein
MVEEVLSIKNKMIGLKAYYGEIKITHNIDGMFSLGMDNCGFCWGLSNETKPLNY